MTVLTSGLANESTTDAENEQPPHADWPKTLEWIEKQAQESLKSRFVTADILAKEAQTTLTVLLAGVGGSAAYGAKIFESPAPGAVAIASALVCVYLVVLSVALVCGCMMLKSFPALAQDPMNLMHRDYSLDAIREAEIKNLGARISEAKQINDGRAKRLNKLRIAAALSPVVFVAAALIAPSSTPKAQEKLVVACSVTHAASGAAPTAVKCEVLQ